MEYASSDIRFDVPLAEACFEDRQEFCANVPPGSARVIRCLQDRHAPRSRVLCSRLGNSNLSRSGVQSRRLCCIHHQDFLLRTAAWLRCRLANCDIMPLAFFTRPFFVSTPWSSVEDEDHPHAMTEGMPDRRLRGTVMPGDG